jgi:hypothetical protein
VTAATEILRPVHGQPMSNAPTQHSPLIIEEKGWWRTYKQSLLRYSPDARAVVEADSEFIAVRADPPFAKWVPTRLRTGIVVGSVQSGKTASMLGVAAKLLDRGVDILVLLSGTRVALWLQTYERMLADLDGSTFSTAWKKKGRVLVPDPYDVLGEEARLNPQGYLNGKRAAVRKAASAGEPLIFVVPKEDDHVRALGRFLENLWTEAAALWGDRKIRMVVLDDEADDASILDALQAERITPKYIQQLWASRAELEETRHCQLFATYIAYTATPQANYLQASHNPLSPRHFHVVLRTPSDAGSLAPRSLTYTERKGLANYYCGGDVFYQRLRDSAGDFTATVPFPQQRPGESLADFNSRFQAVRWELIGDALRAYFVAGALRLLASGQSLQRLASLGPSSADELRALLPPPHTMLYHPSALRDLHFEGADDIARWSAASPGQEQSTPVPRSPDGAPKLCIAGLSARLTSEPHRWRSWKLRFETTASMLAALPGGVYSHTGMISWDLVSNVLQTEIFKFTNLRILNSDPRADERPSFAPRPSSDSAELFGPPSDIYSIFVAGNVLSRGLTVEGLCTSLFLRSAREPAADTQMQMQRWFGYRGAYLPFCRVLMYADQLELFRAYHTNDEALKQEVLSGMEREVPPFHDGVLVLRGANFRATAKVDSVKMPLHPGPTPAVRLVEFENPILVQSNAKILSDLLEELQWTYVRRPADHVRGRITVQPVGMVRVAELLEKFTYTHHRPSADDPAYARWNSLQSTLGLATPLLRVPASGRGIAAVDPAGCPYSIAAYLRLWATVLQIHNAPGLFPTDSDRPWPLIDLARYRRDAPSFYIGIRYGILGDSGIPALAKHGVQAMTRSCADGRPWQLNTLWGTRGIGGGYYGDQLFDYHHHNTGPVPLLHADDTWRPRGHPGLLLFHVIRHASGEDVVTVGLALPHGGPDHIAALRRW